MLARVAFGRKEIDFVKNTSTTNTTKAVTNEVNWLRLPALLAISVFVGLPLTTNVPVNPAAPFASARPNKDPYFRQYFQNIEKHRHVQ